MKWHEFISEESENILAIKVAISHLDLLDRL